MFKLLLGLLAVTSAAFLVAARPENPCTENWPTTVGPKTSLSCPTADKMLGFLIGKSTGPFLCFIVGGITVIIYTCTCVYRACCGWCGSNKVRPGASCCGGGREMDGNYHEEDLFDAYDKKWVIGVKVVTLVMFVLGIIAMAVSFAGVGKVQSFPDKLAEGIKGLVDWVFDIVQRILNAFNSANPAFTPAKNQLDGMKSSMNSLKNQVDQAADSVRPVTAALTGLAVPTVVVFVASLMGACAAVLRIRAWLPAFSILFVILAALPTGGLGAVAGIVNVPFKVWCDEVDAWTSRSPGMFQEYIMPEFCERRIDFKALKDKMNTEANALSSRTCDEINLKCDANDTYTGDQTKVFKCAQTVACSTIAGLVDAVGKLELKLGTPGMCAPPCTISKCATECTGDIKAQAATIWNNANDANNVIKAINDVVDNYLSCDIIMDKLLAAFDFCSTIHAGLNNIYSGSAIGVTVNVILPICMFMGQKRFFKSSAFTREGTSSTGGAEQSMISMGGKDAGKIQTDGAAVEL